MAVNRFTQFVQPARFNPLSFEEMSFAPIALRDRQDRMLNAQDELLNSLSNMEVPDVFQEGFDRERQGLESEISSLSERINKEGVGNLNFMGEFRNIRNKFNQSVGANGNIGRAVNAQTNIDAVKGQYFEHGMAQKWNPELLNKNWNIELDKYKKGLPSDLDQYKGQLPDFSPDFAPENIDFAEEMSELSGKLGAVEETHGRVTSQAQRDAAGNIVNYVFYNNKGKEITNDSNVDALRDYMQNKVLDPGSNLNAALRFRGRDPKEYLNDVETLANVFRKSAVDTTQSFAGQGASLQPKAGSTRKPPSSQNASSLNNMKTGMTKLVHTKSVAAIKGALEGFKTDPELDEQKRNDLIHQYNHALKVKERIEGSDEFKTEINTAIANNDDLGDMGIKTQAQYEAFIASPENNIDPGVAQTRAGQDFQINPSGPLSSPAELATEAYNQAYENLPKSLLSDSNYYNIGFFAEDRKLAEIMSEGMHSADLQSLAADGSLAIAEMNTADFTSTKEEDGEDRLNKLQDAINKSEPGAVSFTLKAIDDGGATANPSLIYNVQVKNKGDNATNYSLSMDLDGSSLSRQIMSQAGDLYEGLDHSSKAVIDHIRDKVNYRGLATDIESPDMFSKNDTNNIITHARQANQNLGIYPRSDNDPANKYNWIKNEPGVDYAVVINGDSSYSLTKRDANGNSQDYTIDDYAKKQGFIEYGDNPQYPEKYILDFMFQRHALTGDIKNPSQTSILYSNSNIYKEALNEYDEAVFNNPNDFNAINSAAIQAYGRIKNLRLQSKLVKNIF